MLSALGVLSAASCGGSSAPGKALGGGAGASVGGSAGAAVATQCSPGDTRECRGPGACRGAQWCGDDQHWTFCDCGQVATGGDTSGGSSSAGAAAGGASGGSLEVGEAGEAGAGGSGESPEGQCPNGVLGHCDAHALYPTYAGYSLSLVEDFPVPIDLDKDPIFTWSDGAPDGSQTGFRKQNLVFENGKLSINAESDCTPSTANSQCYPKRDSYAEARSGETTHPVPAMGVWSGALVSKYNNFRYGRYEAKFKAPVANSSPGKTGDYVSTLFLFRDPRDAIPTELDIELDAHVRGSLKGLARGATGAVDAWTELGSAGYQITEEHVYAMTWTPDAIDWYIDGGPVHHAAAGVSVPTASAKIKLNLWVDVGSFFGIPADNQYPFKAEYEWVRFYKFDTEKKYPCSPTPGCLDATDKLPSARNNPNETSYGQ